MKHSNISIRSAVGMALAIFVLGLSGCAKENGSQTQNPEFPQEAFDFSTRSTYTLNVAYAVPDGYEIYFEVYAENPLTADATGSLVKRTDVQPIDKGFTDGKGAYKNPIIVSSAIETLYIYTPYAGVPRLLTCRVENGMLTTPTMYLPAQSATAGTRSVASGNQVEFNGITTVTLGTWRHSDSKVTFPQALPTVSWPVTSARLRGRPDYMYAANQSIFPNEGTKPAIEISADIYKTISTQLPGDNNGPADPRILQNGAIKVTKNAEIELYFVAQGGMYENVLAYYCYPTGQAPSDPSQIKTQAIALPNATCLSSHGVPVDSDVYDYGALLPGEGVRLHYIDTNGVDQGTTFPAGTSIGWILYSKGYLRAYATNPFAEIGKLTAGAGPIYSDSKLMKNEIPHTAVFRHGDFAVLAFEDCIQTTNSACDYDDAIFHIAATPSEAITPDIPNVDPNQPTETEVTYRGILSFEDNWPYRGDFDMNDVVINYESVVTYNTNNEVTKTVDKYTVVWSGAQYNNSFAIENTNLSIGNGTVTFQGGGDEFHIVEDDIIRATGPVLEYANLPEKHPLTVTTKFATPIAKSAFVHAPYNPFIVVNGDKTREVHLTNMKPSIYNDTKWFGYGHDKSNPVKGLYYITFDDNGIQMPFAMDILFNSQEEMDTYVIPEEMKSINLYYPGFLRWVQSGGTTDKDWYLHPIKK